MNQSLSRPSRYSQTHKLDTGFSHSITELSVTHVNMTINLTTKLHIVLVRFACIRRVGLAEMQINHNSPTQTL